MPPVENPLAVMASTHSIEHERLSKIALELLNNAKVPKELGIGAELEFFLRDQNSNNLCVLDQSQAFLVELSQLPGWSIYSRNEKTEKVLRVSKNIDDKRYHTIKYEHPPHMMEAALAYETDLIRFHESFRQLLDELSVAARNSGVALDVSIQVESKPIPWECVGKIESRFELLSKSRRKLFEDRAGTEPDSRIDFTSYTAATQFHIGGSKWWEQRPYFIDSLYRFEFLISGIPYHQRKADFERRWSSYGYVFANMPLLGFPRMDEWTYDHWLDCILKTPTLDENKRLFSDSVMTSSEEELKIKLKSVRDLQIIRPKWIGTLEYRSDPAMSDPDLISQMAALRFASYIYALSGGSCQMKNELPFLELSKQWWNGLHLTDFSGELNNLKDICYNILTKRGLNEERFL